MFNDELFEKYTLLNINTILQHFQRDANNTLLETNKFGLRNIHTYKMICLLVFQKNRFHIIHLDTHNTN